MLILHAHSGPAPECEFWATAMPFEVCALSGTPFVLSRLYESVDVEDLLNLLHSLTVHPGVLDGKRVICDGRDGRADLSYDDLHQVTSFVRTHESVFSGMQWATVVSGLLEFGLARSAGLMTGDLSFEYRVFRCIDEACNWVGLPGQHWAANQHLLGHRDG
jgi:hypothetical protein